MGGRARDQRPRWAVLRAGPLRWRSRRSFQQQRREGAAAAGRGERDRHVEFPVTGLKPRAYRLSIRQEHRRQCRRGRKRNSCVGMHHVLSRYSSYADPRSPSVWDRRVYPVSILALPYLRSRARHGSIVSLSPCLLGKDNLPVRFNISTGIQFKEKNVYPWDSKDVDGIDTSTTTGSVDQPAELKNKDKPQARVSIRSIGFRRACAVTR